MFENIAKFFKKLLRAESQDTSSRETAKERLHLVLMQDRANVSADFLEMMKQEIIEVIKKYIDVDENAIDVKLTNKTNDDGTNGAPALYANIPIISIKESKKEENTEKLEKPVEENANKLKEENKKPKKENKKKEENSKEEKVEDNNDKKTEEEKAESTDISEEENKKEEAETEA